MSEKQLHTKTQHIWCNAAITKKMENIFVGYICNQIQNDYQVTDYIIYLSIIEGSAASAINLYNFMRSIPQTTTVYNMGSIASVGLPFFLGFKNRIGVPGCNFSIQQTSVSKGYLLEHLSEQVNAVELENQKKGLDMIDKQTQEIILTETASRVPKLLDNKIVEKAFLNSVTYGANEAKEYGFIDKIELPKLERDIFFLTDQWLATQPE
jgi:ATP-dependent protease ClpP protease subunit